MAALRCLACCRQGNPPDPSAGIPNWVRPRPLHTGLKREVHHNDAIETIRECRHCGTTVDPNSAVWSNYNKDEIYAYTIQQVE